MYVIGLNNGSFLLDSIVIMVRLCLFFACVCSLGLWIWMVLMMTMNWNLRSTVSFSQYYLHFDIYIVGSQLVGHLIWPKL